MLFNHILHKRKTDEQFIADHRAELQKYLDKNLKKSPLIQACRPRDSKNQIQYSKRPSEDAGIKYSLPDLPEISYSLKENYSGIVEAIQPKETFQTKVMKYIEDQQLDAKMFYTRAGMDRKLFSALKNGGANYHPSKNTAIQCCLAMQLPLEDANELLKTAGYALSESQRSDLIVRYCIENRIWNVLDVDTLLDDFHESTLTRY